MFSATCVLLNLTALVLMQGSYRWTCSSCGRVEHLPQDDFFTCCDIVHRNAGVYEAPTDEERLRYAVNCIIAHHAAAEIDTYESPLDQLELLVDYLNGLPGS